MNAPVRDHLANRQKEGSSNISKTLFYTLVGILFIKGVFLLIDSRPSYFFGDSGAYLATATAKLIPADRSFLYGLFIRKTAYRLHSLQLIIWIQVLLSAAAAWLLSFALAKIFSVRLWLAVGAGILCAVEPLQLLAERYIMTESCANFLFALHFVLVLLYIQNGKLRFLIPAQAVGVLLIAFRISFLPLVLTNSVLPPLLSPAAIVFLGNMKQKRRIGSRIRSIALVGVHICLSLAVSQGLLTIYKHWYGQLIGREPALFYQEGAFLVAALSPLIEPEDFPVPSRRTSIFSNLRFDRHDLSTRPAQHFLEGGLWPNILKEFPNEREANHLAVSTAVHAILRRPSTTVGLAFQTFLLYFDSRLLRQRLISDQGANGAMDANIRDWLQGIYAVSNPHGYEVSVVKKWHLFVMPWYWFILCSLPLWPLLFFAYQRDDWALLLVCTLTGLLFLEGATFLVDAPTPRFLTSAAWISLLMLGLTANLLYTAVPDGQDSAGM